MSLLCILTAITISSGQDELLLKVKKNYGGDVSLTTSFDLAIFWKVREKQDKKTGKIVFAPGNCFQIELGNSMWTSNGITMWQYDKALSQVLVKTLASCDPSQLPARMITSYLTKYPLSVEKKEGALVTASWTADSTISKAAEAKKVSCVIDSKTATIIRLFVVDRMGNESTYMFHGTTIGKNYPETYFTFKIPKGAHVLDENQ
jgi:outer membrane lipoprotein-sorting protein